MEAKGLDAGRHILDIEVEARADFGAAQAALAPTAGRLCAAPTSFLGAFKFADRPVAPGAQSGVEQAGFQQELYCSSPAQFSESAAAAAPSPSQARHLAVLKATYSYLAAKDSNRLSDAYAMLSPRAKLASVERNWIARAGDFNARAGAVRARRVTEISWYSDPPDAPEPGLYVAADLEGVFENLEFLCGYVVWRLDRDGSLRLVREEQNFLERRRGAKLAQVDRAALRAQMGCRD